MAPAQMLIPPKLRVGFNKRDDTYNGLLAFIVYYDTKGVLRQEKSWNEWRDEKIEAQEFPNEPTEGFVLNKGVGGQRHSYGHYARNEAVRVHDPRGFEFEISVANLMFILSEGICYPGKGLDGKFVYAWRGPKPILLPVSSLDYKKSSAFTSLQTQGVSAKDMVAGHTYLTKRQEQWVYLGKFDYYFALNYRAGKNSTGVVRKMVFARPRTPPEPTAEEIETQFHWAAFCPAGGGWELVYHNDQKALAELSSTTCPDNFAELVELHTNSPRGSRIAKLFLKPGNRLDLDRFRNDWYFEIKPGVFADANTSYDDGKPAQIHVTSTLQVKDGILVVEDQRPSLYSSHPDFRQERYEGPTWGTPTIVKPQSPHPWRETEDTRLFALLECGTEFCVSPYNLSKERS